MPEQTQQTFANHTRWDPAFHFFAMPVFLITFFLAVWNMIQNFSFPSAWMVVLAAAAIVAVLRTRPGSRGPSYRSRNRSGIKSPSLGKANWSRYASHATLSYPRCSRKRWPGT